MFLHHSTVRLQVLIIVCILIIGAFTSASAASLIITDEANFLSILQLGYYYEDFEGVAGGIYTDTLLFSSGGYSYQAYASNLLWVGAVFQPPAYDWDAALGLNDADDTLLFSLLSGNVTAVGGYFGWDCCGSEETIIRAEINDGTYVDISGTPDPLTGGFLSFVGFVSPDGTPITSLTLRSLINYPDPGWAWAVTSELYVGQTTIPEPSSALLEGIGLLLIWGIKKRVSAG